MINSKHYNKIYKGVALLLFSFVFVYILLRIIFTETLHDEVATYIFYFYHGDYIGDNIQWDANNHLLNSFIGHQLYKLFGDNMSVLRLPNLLAFVFYFWGTFKLTKDLKTPYLKITGLVALNTIPFIMEYFGNARGYGLALGFFVCALVHLHEYLKSLTLSSLALCYLFLLLSVSANLTYINSSLILVVLFIIAPFFLIKKRLLLRRIKEYGLHFLFLSALVPFVLFGLALKETKALYYGSLDGLWEVTGKTLSQFVFFYSDDWLKYAFLFFFLILIVFILIRLRNLPLSSWLQEKGVVYAWLFFGNLIGIIILAHGFDINYPEDRTGMYLAILFLLLLLYLLDNIKPGKWLQVSLLFFPVTFVLHLSLHTSVFSPDDRLNKAFYEKVKSNIKPENSLMIYWIINWNWPYHESHSVVKSSVGQFNDPNTTLSDFIVTKTTMLKNKEIPKLYDTIAVHLPSTYIAFKRKQFLLKKEIEVSSIIDLKSSKEFLDIATFEFDDLSGKNLQVTVVGHLKTTESKNKVLLVVNSTNTKAKEERYYYYSFETVYQSQLIDDDFLHHFIIDNIGPHEKQIKVYLWNRGLHPLEITGSKALLFELNEADNESR